MPNNDLSKEKKIILLCCCANPSQEKIAALENLLGHYLDWDFIVNSARVHGIAPFIYHALICCANRERVPAIIMQELSSAYRRSAFVNVVFLKEYKEILCRFNAENIAIIPLKGIVLIKEIYQNIALRTLSDIDLLIRKRDLKQGVNVLRNLGFIQKKTMYQPEEHYHHIFQRQSRSVPITVELHWEIDIPNSPYHIVIDDLWDRAAVVQSNNTRYWSLALEDNILFNCFHILRRPLADGVIPMKNFCDVYEILARRQAEINWQIITERAVHYNIVRPVFLVLLFLKRYFAAPIPNTICDLLMQEGFQENMLVDILHKRLFIQDAEKIFLPGMLAVSQKRRWYRVPVNFASFFTTLSHLSKYFTAYTPFNSLLGLRVVARRVKRSLLNYINILYLYIFDRHTIKELHGSLLNDKKRIDLIDQWLRSK